MPLKNHLLLLTVVGLLFVGRAASACSCAGKPTTLSAYEGAYVVVIAKAVSVEDSVSGRDYEGIKSTKMIIQKVFKGDVKAGDGMTFGQGAIVNCVWGFERQSVGQQFLLYLGPRDERSKLWYVMACGRSDVVRGVADATDDLLYLNRLEEVRGKTRISGTISFPGESALLEGRTIRIVRGEESYEVKTNQHGVYEIYDIPAGNYLIEPEVPAGWKLSESWLHYSLSLKDDQGRSPKKIPVSLGDGRHASLDIYYEIDDTISSKAKAPGGQQARHHTAETIASTPKDHSEG